MLHPRAFISFQMEDRWARNFLAQHARDKRNDIEFLDYSVKEPFESAWKTNCKARIAQTKGTIVLVGQTTYQSPAVLWEIEETKRQGNKLFGVKIHRDKICPTPNGLPTSRVVGWDFDSIVAELARWQA
jgi:hypothetical protein